MSRIPAGRWAALFFLAAAQLLPVSAAFVVVASSPYWSLSSSALTGGTTVILFSSSLSFSSSSPPPSSSSSSSRLYHHGNNDENNGNDIVDMADVGFVLLAGGKGSRMKANMPKQFLELCGAPILHHSLDLFLQRLPEYLTSQNKAPPAFVVLVLDPVYHDKYQPLINADKFAGRLFLADPGVERQGSVENGLQRLIEVSKGTCRYAAIHDSARPLVTIDEICHVVQDAKEYGAAVLGVPCKATIKESADGTTVLRTIPRTRLWEVHTPQVIDIEKLQRGFEKVAAENLQVTDDVSIVEALGEPVKLTLGQYTNLKITTPEDLDVAKAILLERNAPPVHLLQKEMA